MSKKSGSIKDFYRRVCAKFYHLVQALGDLVSRCLFVMTGIKLDFNCIDWNEEVETYDDFETPPPESPWYIKLMWDPEEEYLRDLEHKIIESYEGVRESGVLDFCEKLEEIKSKRAKEKSKSDEVVSAKRLPH